MNDERDGYPAGVPCWVDTAQPDPEAAVDFYGGLFGWEFEETMPADAPGHYFIGRLRGLDVAAVGSQPEGSPPQPAWNTYIAGESADETAAQIRAAGGTVVTEPFDVPAAGRMAVLADRAGAVFSIWQPREFKGAQLVNVPGTWGWSDLNTRDFDAIKELYGAVFGWEADTTESGGEWATLRRPGYGDFLERSDPDLRKRLAENKAPAGFEDVVSGLVRMTSERYSDDTPSHWGVTFGVEDTDAAADKAGTLGAKVLVPPIDLPPVRVAVLADPQGAVFSVSKYTPPE